MTAQNANDLFFHAGWLAFCKQASKPKNPQSK